MSREFDLNPCSLNSPATCQSHVEDFRFIEIELLRASLSFKIITIWLFISEKSEKNGSINSLLLEPSSGYSELKRILFFI